MLHTKTEGVACVHLAVYAARLEHIGVNHSATENFNPTCMLTESTTLATTDVARDVHLGARLCEGEVARAQTNLCVRTKELACEGQEHLLKVCERHVFVNIQTFELMEEAMGACRNCLVTEHTSGANDTYWWLLLLHNSALVVAGVRTQNDVLCHIVGVGLYEEGVLHQS